MAQPAKAAAVPRGAPLAASGGAGAVLYASDGRHGPVDAARLATACGAPMPVAGGGGSGVLAAEATRRRGGGPWRPAGSFADERCGALEERERHHHPSVRVERHSGPTAASGGHIGVADV